MYIITKQKKKRKNSAHAQVGAQNEVADVYQEVQIGVCELWLNALTIQAKLI